MREPHYPSALGPANTARVRAAKLLKSDISEKVKALKKHNNKKG